MLKRLLKKDLMHRKSVNLILFLFITIATVFLASSVNNILVVSSSVDYYMDYANIPDVNLVAVNPGEKESIMSWIKTKAPGVKDYGYQEMLSVYRMMKLECLHSSWRKTTCMLGIHCASA